MNISGVLVNAHPAQCESVREKLMQLEGVEVHAISAEGRMVITVEQDDTHQMADTVVGLQNIKGVLAASVVYHNYEDNEEAPEDISTLPTEVPCACDDLTGQEASK